MIRLAIGDNLLIEQAALTKIKPWSYVITHIPTEAEVKSQANINTDYISFALDEPTFGSYLDEQLLLEIKNGAGLVIEEDNFLVSGIYNRYEEIQFLAGLLGENQKQESADTDFQDGFQTAKTVTIYTSESLVTPRETYDWSQSFVSDFLPDARYHRLKEIQKAT